LIGIALGRSQPRVNLQIAAAVPRRPLMISIGNFRIPIDDDDVLSRRGKPIFTNPDIRLNISPNAGHMRKAFL
jgi:hypothetical protein